MPRSSDIEGVAALTICEALLLALNDHSVLPETEIIGVLADAAATHRHAQGAGIDAERHEAVADLIDKIVAGGNSVRRTSNADE